MGLKEDYAKEIAGWDWKKIVAECKSNVQENEEGEKEGMCYIGSVMNLTPSGKLYTPFANSNLDLCEKCQGSGSVTNLKADLNRHSLLDKRDNELTRKLLDSHGSYTEWPEDEMAKIKKLRDGKEECKPTLTCETCGGIGSEEAFKDQEWQEALEEVAGNHDCWVTSGEGSMSDMFVGMGVDEDEEVPA